MSPWKPRCQSVDELVKVMNNLMESIIPNALMKWNSAFATLPPPARTCSKQGVNALEPLTTLQVNPIQ